MHVVGKPLFTRLSLARKPSCLPARDILSVCTSRRGVGMFSGKVNPVTGRMEWVAQERDVMSEDSDLSPELARSQYGDMLHDTIRVSLASVALDSLSNKVYNIVREN